MNKVDGFVDLDNQISMINTEMRRVRIDMVRLNQWGKKQGIDCTSEVKKLIGELQLLKATSQGLQDNLKLVQTMPKDTVQSETSSPIEAQKRMMEARRNYELWQERTENYDWEKLEARNIWERLTKEYLLIKGKNHGKD